MSNYGAIKKGITFVEPTNESRSVIPFYFRKKYVPFRLGTGSSYYFVYKPSVKTLIILSPFCLHRVGRRERDM